MGEQGDANAAPIKVLYLHGIEETAESPKPTCLTTRGDMVVNCPELACHPLKKNGPLVGLLLCPWFQFTMFIGICFGELMHNQGGFNDWGALGSSTAP